MTLMTDLNVTTKQINPPITFQGKEGNVEIHNQKINGEEQWAVRMVRTTLGDKWVAVFSDQTMALEYSAWLAKRI